MMAPMLKQFRSIPQSLVSVAASLDDAETRLSDAAEQVAGQAGDIKVYFARASTQVEAAARSHEAAADAVRELALVAAGAIGLVLLVWGARQVKAIAWG